MNNKGNKDTVDKLNHLIIPDDHEMEKAWNSVEEYKDEYPRPDMNSVWHKVNDNLGLSDKKVVPLHRRILRYAAIILPLLMVATGLYLSKDKINQKLNYITYNSPSGLRSKINLSDGSIIWLQPKSQIKYPKKFSAKSREIFFTGQAYFDIAKNPEKPFIVHTNDIDVSVLGTQFYVKANSVNDYVETGLISGKVKLKNSFIEEFLKPNDIVVFSRSKNQITEKKDLSSNSYKWNNGSLVFDNCEFGTILKDISEWYNMDLDIDNNINLNTNLTLTVREESINEIMEILQMVVPFKYEVKEDKLRILESN